MAFKFGTASIMELGEFVSNKLKEDGITKKAELMVYVNKDEFRKIDEDLYYRTKDNNSKEFIPSEGEIDVNFEMIKILVKES